MPPHQAVFHICALYLLNNLRGGSAKVRMIGLRKSSKPEGQRMSSNDKRGHNDFHPIPDTHA